MSVFKTFAIILLLLTVSVFLMRFLDFTFIVMLVGLAFFFGKIGLKLLHLLFKPLFWLFILALIGWLLLTAFKLMGA
jgi:hypothetical protein